LVAAAANQSGPSARLAAAKRFDASSNWEAAAVASMAARLRTPASASALPATAAFSTPIAQTATTTAAATSSSTMTVATWIQR
jgi:hypothetical protein